MLLRCKRSSKASCLVADTSDDTVGCGPGRTGTNGADRRDALGIFGRYLSVWVAIAIVVGVVLGDAVPSVPDTLADWEISGVNIVVAVLIWAMILPMMVSVDFGSVRRVGREPAGLAVTTTVNWLLKPFSMYLFAWFFLTVAFDAFIDDATADGYLAGAILLGAAPCTAMVFVWSLLVRGDAGYTLVQVAVNDIIMLIAFAPIVVTLLGISDIDVPWSTVAMSVLLYIVVPLGSGVLARRALVRRRGQEWFTEQFLPRLGPVTPTGLIITLVLLFAFQGDIVTSSPGHIALIAVPLVLQTVFVYAVGYQLMRWRRVRHEVAAPGALVGASNFFELAVAAAIALFGLDSAAALATVVGVLVEVPLMLALVAHANRTRHRFVVTT